MVMALVKVFCKLTERQTTDRQTGQKVYVLDLLNKKKLSIASDLFKLLDPLLHNSAFSRDLTTKSFENNVRNRENAGHSSFPFQGCLSTLRKANYKMSVTIYLYLHMLYTWKSPKFCHVV